MRTLGFVLELPWELGVPDGFVVPAWSSDADARPGFAIRRAAGLEGPPAAGCGLRGWLTFATVEVPVQLPLAASDLAFAHLRADVTLGDEFRRRRDELIAGGCRERRTVALATVVVAEGDPELELSRALFDAIGLLNAWLVALGVSHDQRLRPVSVGDLPRVVPCLPAVWRADGTRVNGPTLAATLRDAPVAIRTYSDRELRQASRMFEVIAGDGSYATFYEIVQRAGAAMAADRYREAVIDYATAGEIFISDTLQAVATRREVPERKAANLASGPFKDRAMAMSRMLRRASEPTDPESLVFLWWVHCYLRRNPIVHAGRDTLQPLAEMARVATVSLVVDVREALRRDEALADLAASIQWGSMEDETAEGRNSFPDVVDEPSSPE
jgi:hypothetical protein